MTHARRGHQCEFCEKVAFGNGGKVSHGRSHVRRGEAVELVKHYSTWPQIVTRIFVAAGDQERIEKYLGEGFERVEEKRTTK